MSDITEYVCDPYFGLTEIEVKLLRWSMQGVSYRPGAIPTDFAQELAASVWDAREGFTAMQRDFGLDPADPTPPADRSFEYTDLVKKLQAMDEPKARHLYFFVVGYLAAWENDPQGDA